jgi:hypothetical protein
MIAQLKEDKLEGDGNLIKIPSPTVSWKLVGTMEENVNVNISDENTMEIDELKSNLTPSKVFNSDTPKIATAIIKEINTKGKEGIAIPHESTTEDTLEQMNNETMEKCSEIPSHLQGKLTIVKEVGLWKILKIMLPIQVNL